MAKKKPPKGPGPAGPKDAPATKDWLAFVQLDPFPPAWRRLALGDDDLRRLELAILADPGAAPVVARTGGIRKMRFAPASWAMGKRGACRVYYAHFPEHGLVALVYAHSKAESESISAEQARVLKGLMDEVGRALDERRRGRKAERRI